MVFFKRAPIRYCNSFEVKNRKIKKLANLLILGRKLTIADSAVWIYNWPSNEEGPLLFVRTAAIYRSCNHEAIFYLQLFHAVLR